MAMQELNIYALWGGKQTGKGVAAGALNHRLVQVAGTFNAPRDDGQQAYSDLDKFQPAVDWVNTLVGNGNPGILATPDELAWSLKGFHGGEAVVAVVGPPPKNKHTFTPLPGGGDWLTYQTRLGAALPSRKQWVDCRTTSLQIEGSTANKAVRMTPTVISLDPAITIAADPAKVMPLSAPFIYTDGSGAFTIDGNVHRGHSQFTLVLNEDLQPVYGDDVTVHDLVVGNATVTIACTIYMDADGNAQFNRMAYGVAAPPPGTKPIKTVPALGAYGFLLKAREAATGDLTGDEFGLDIPGVKWTLPEAPGPNPEGGTPELSLAGALRKVAGEAGYTIDVTCDAAAFTD